MAGTRSIPTVRARRLLDLQLKRIQPKVIVHGASGNVDRAAGEWAHANGIPQHQFPPAFDKYGEGAGPARNQTIVDMSGYLVLIWNGRSPGSKDILIRALKRGLVVIQEVV